MSNFSLSLLIAIVANIVSEIVKALVKWLVSRKKERTAPISSRDGSIDTK